jgi:uncharacterized protein YdaU (DUF1376 family)
VGLPYFKCYPSDFLSDPAVLRMSDEELGVYVRLLFISWLDDGRISSDMDELARVLKTTPRRLKRLWPALESRWVGDGNGKLFNPRLEKERKEAEATHQALSEAGRKGAEARKAGH